MFGKFGKSIWKGVKYAGLTAGGAALVGFQGVVPGYIVDVLTSAGVAEGLAVMVGTVGTPLLGGAVAVALEQVRKHRDEIFNGAK